MGISQWSSPVHDDRCVGGLLAYLSSRDVVTQGVESPAEEGGLLVEEAPPGGQALGRGPQQTGPQSLSERLGQGGLTWRERGVGEGRWKEGGRKRGGRGVRK